MNVHELVYSNVIIIHCHQLNIFPPNGWTPFHCRESARLKTCPSHLKKPINGRENERLFSSWICFAFLKQNNSGFYLLEICLVKKYLNESSTGLFCFVGLLLSRIFGKVYSGIIKPKWNSRLTFCRTTEKSKTSWLGRLTPNPKCIRSFTTSSWLLENASWPLKCLLFKIEIGTEQFLWEMSFPMTTPWRTPRAGGCRPGPPAPSLDQEEQSIPESSSNIHTSPGDARILLGAHKATKSQPLNWKRGRAAVWIQRGGQEWESPNLRSALAQSRAPDDFPAVNLQAKPSLAMLTNIPSPYGHHNPLLNCWPGVHPIISIPYLDTISTYSLFFLHSCGDYLYLGENKIK